MNNITGKKSYLEVAKSTTHFSMKNEDIHNRCTCSSMNVHEVSECKFAYHQIVSDNTDRIAEHNSMENDDIDNRCTCSGINGNESKECDYCYQIFLDDIDRVAEHILVKIKGKSLDDSMIHIRSIKIENFYACYVYDAVICKLLKNKHI